MDPRVIAVSNQKGGVAKTTTVVNVAACAAETGLKVLVIDLDPQDASATSWLTLEAPKLGTWDVLAETHSINDVVAATTAPGVDLVASSADLYAIERLAAGTPGLDTVLATAITHLDGYDLVLIDSPPALGLLTASALIAAGEVVVPVTPDALALTGVAQLMTNIARVTQRLNPALRLSAIIPCRVPARQSLAHEALAALVEEFGDKVTSTVRRAARAEEAPGHHQALTTYAPTAAVTADYRAVTATLLNEGENR